MFKVISGASIKWRALSKVLKQSHKKQKLPANRGNIYDRDNRPLTRNIIHYTLSVNPSKVINKKEIAEELSKQTGKPKGNI